MSETSPTRGRHVSGESTKSSTSTDSYSNYIPTPPDGGWGWVIVVASLFCNIIVDGIGYSFGVFLREFVDYFGESKAKTSLVGSLLCGVYLCVGPLVSALTNRYGCRRVTIAGSIVGTIAFLLSTLSQNLEQLTLLYGVLGGIGFGMIYLPSIVSVGYYFEKKRALATGIAVCGSGIGTFIFAPLSNILLNEYDWKSAMYIVAGVVLNGCVCGSLMRPLEARPVKKPKRPRTKNMLDRFKEQTGIGRNRTESECSTAAYSVRDPAAIMERVKEAKEARVRRIREECGSESSDVNSQLDSPCRSQPVTIPTIIMEDTKYCDSQGVLNGSPGRVSFGSPTRKVSVQETPKVTTEVSLDSNGDIKTSPATKPNSLPLNGYVPNDEGDRTLPSDSLLSPEDAKKSRFTDQVKSDSNIWVSNKGTHHRKRQRTDSITKEDYSRPMYRQDIFFSGSVLNFKEFRSQPDVETYVKSITTIPQDDVDGGECWIWRRLPCISKASRDTLQMMLNCNLLKNVPFLFLCVGNIFGMCGFYVPFVYITDRAVLLGIDKADAAFLVSVIGITNTIGRILSGILADLPRVDALLLNNVCLFISGIATLLSPFCTTYVMLVIYTSIFGLCISAYISLTSIILCNLLGLEHLTNAFGLLTLARGISSIAGPPIAGAIYDSTGSYDTSFYVSGCLIITAGLFHMVLYLPYFKRYAMPNEPEEDHTLTMREEDGSTVDQTMSVV